MTTILCDQDDRLRELIVRFAETLKTEAHQLGDHGLSERDFYQGGLFRGAIERVRGQFSASMRDKREFVKHILNFLEDGRFIRGWEPAYRRLVDAGAPERVSGEKTATWVARVLPMFRRVSHPGNHAYVWRWDAKVPGLPYPRRAA